MIKIKAENAQQMLSWLKDRGGIFQWNSLDLSDPDWGCFTPAETEHGEPYPKPSWKAANTPAQHVTSPDDVLVFVPMEYKRFHIAIRMGSQGMSLKLTSGSSNKLRRYLAKAEERCSEAWYEFDYATQECVIYVPSERPLPLPQYLEQQTAAV